MKKYILVLIASIVLLSACQPVSLLSPADYSFHRDEVYALAQELNDNSDFGGLALTSVVPKDLRSALNYEPWVTDYTSTENIESTFLGFDHDYRLMLILLKSDEYNIIGIKIGDTLSAAARVLHDYGYSYKGEEENYSGEHVHHLYTKGEYGRASVTLITEPDKNVIVLLTAHVSDNYEEELLGAY